MIKYMAVDVAVAVAVSGGAAVAVPVAGLTKRFFDHIQKDFLINVWGYFALFRTISRYFALFRILKSPRASTISHYFVILTC